MTATEANTSAPHPEQQEQLQQPAQQQAKRPVCLCCGRPLRVCYCAALPPEPVVLGGRVVVLQHPHETKRTLATLPLLSRVLSPSSLTVLVGRRLVNGKWQQWDDLLAAVQQQQVPLLVLFPGPGAKDLSEVAQHLQQQQQQQRATQSIKQQQQQQQHLQEQQVVPGYVLLVVDSTWRQAREMFDALRPWLLGPGGCGQQVQLPQHQQQQQPPVVHQVASEQQHQGQQQSADAATACTAAAAAAVPGSTLAGNVSAAATSAPAAAAAPSAPDPAAAAAAVLLSQRDAGSRLRTEPAEGCCTTLEAIAVAVSLLEHDPRLFEVCMAPLRLLTHHQAAFDPAVAARLAPGGFCVVATKHKLGMRRRLGGYAERAEEGPKP